MHISTDLFWVENAFIVHKEFGDKIILLVRLPLLSWLIMQLFHFLKWTCFMCPPRQLVNEKRRQAHQTTDDEKNKFFPKLLVKSASVAYLHQVHIRN